MLKEELVDWLDQPPGHKPQAAGIDGPLARWERWRIGFNFILLAEVAVFSLVARGCRMGFQLSPSPLIVQCLCANICYCAGPVAEFYLVRIGFRRGPAGVAVFALGMISAAYLALISLTQMCESALLGFG